MDKNAQVHWFQKEVNQVRSATQTVQWQEAKEHHHDNKGLMGQLLQIIQYQEKYIPCWG